MSKKNSRRRTRNVLLIVSMMLVVAMASVGGTLAWLTAQTDSVTNTFTAGDINIELKEHDYDPATKLLTTTEVVAESDYKIVPGTNLPKDPFVRVKANSEACWLFVEVTESDNWLTKMTYELDTGWTKLETTDGKDVYYREVAATATSDVEVNILKDKTVKVPDTITKTELNALNGAKPTLSFKAYAIQKENVDTATDAWTKISTAE